MIAILTYHALDDSGAVTAVHPDRFRAHLRFLAGRGYEVIDLDRLLAILAGRAPEPARAAVITFDDGYRSVHGEALAELRRQEFPATAFVTTGHSGGQNDWPTQPAHVPRREMLRPEEIRELHAAGFTIGAHSVSHAHLPALPDDTAREEIEGSKQWLEDLLGAPVRHFAYPYGETSPMVRALAAMRFESACGTDLAPVRRGIDRYMLPRIDAFYLDGCLRLGGPHTAAGRVYLEARRWLRIARAIATA